MYPKFLQENQVNQFGEETKKGQVRERFELSEGLRFFRTELGANERSPN